MLESLEGEGTNDNELGFVQVVACFQLSEKSLS